MNGCAFIVADTADTTVEYHKSYKPQRRPESERHTADVDSLHTAREHAGNKHHTEECCEDAGDLSGDGTPRIFPLQCGDGTYTLRVMENITDNKYAELYSIDQDVVLNDEFQPYLRPTAYVNFTADSLCVQKANELVATADTEEDVVKAIFDYVTKNIKYDKEKAEAATTIYLPDPDETMTSGKGICFDYASLTASMLRSQGIPTKVIFGYVSPDDLYHAWNMFYTEQTGWVTVEFAVDPNDWNRLDLTFSAGGTDEKFIGDGSNYTDVYWY